MHLKGYLDKDIFFKIICDKNSSLTSLITTNTDIEFSKIFRLYKTFFRYLKPLFNKEINKKLKIIILYTKFLKNIIVYFPFLFLYKKIKFMSLRQ